MTFYLFFHAKDQKFDLEEEIWTSTPFWKIMKILQSWAVSFCKIIKSINVVIFTRSPCISRPTDLDWAGYFPTRILWLQASNLLRSGGSRDETKSDLDDLPLSLHHVLWPEYVPLLPIRLLPICRVPDSYKMQFFSLFIFFFISIRAAHILPPSIELCKLIGSRLWLRSYFTRAPSPESSHYAMPQNKNCWLSIKIVAKVSPPV